MHALLFFRIHLLLIIIFCLVLASISSMILNKLNDENRCLVPYLRDAVSLSSFRMVSCGFFTDTLYRVQEVSSHFYSDEFFLNHKWVLKFGI